MSVILFHNQRNDCRVHYVTRWYVNLSQVVLPVILHIIDQITKSGINPWPNQSPGGNTERQPPSFTYRLNINQQGTATDNPRMGLPLDNGCIAPAPDQQ